jgi:hypothetical protein
MSVLREGFLPEPTIDGFVAAKVSDQSVETPGSRRDVTAWFQSRDNPFIQEFVPLFAFSHCSACQFFEQRIAVIKKGTVLGEPPFTVFEGQLFYFVRHTIDLVVVSLFDVLVEDTLEKTLDVANADLGAVFVPLALTE